MTALALLPPVVLPDLDQAFAEFLQIEVANGDASSDTVRGYRAQLGRWLAWCRENGLVPERTTVADVKAYRRELVEAGRKAAGVSFALAVLRRVYAAAVVAGLRPDNPVIGVKAPRDRRSPDDLDYLSEEDLVRLLVAIPRSDGPRYLRDRVIVCLMALQGLRTVEVARACVDDLEERGSSTILRVRGKGHDRIAYLRADVANLLLRYLDARGPVVADTTGTPLIVAVGNRAGGCRISRRGIRQIVDGYLEKARLKRPGRSGHALRSFCATSAYRHTLDLRAVQVLLGHADPRTTSRYARVVDREKNNPANAIPVSV